MAEQNYYQILGVANTATDDDIKKVYRKLVRQYHPDVSKDPDADQKMASINTAYETLRDAAKRAEYDQLLAQPQGFAGFGADPRQASGFSGQGFSNQGFSGFGGSGFDGAGFNDAGFNGSGFDFSDLFGQASRPRRDPNQPWRGEDQHAVLSVDLAALYSGATRRMSLRVPQTDQVRTLEVNIPKGVLAGQHIRLTGQGLAGGQGGAAGDLYLEIAISPDARYRVEGADVYMALPVAPWEAALGGPVAVTTPSGGTVQVNIPAHSQGGRQLRLKGQGIPAKTAGDLYLTLNIVLPAAQTEAAKAAYARMAQDLAFNPRQGSDAV